MRALVQLKQEREFNADLGEEHVQIFLCAASTTDPYRALFIQISYDYAIGVSFANGYLIDTDHADFSCRRTVLNNLAQVGELHTPRLIPTDLVKFCHLG